MNQTGSVASSGGETATDGVDPDLQTRMDALMRVDTAWAVGFVVALWAAYLYVFVQVLPHAKEPGVTAVLVIFGLLVGLFNTVSVVAMVRQYRKDQTYIYALDIRHDDANRAAKAAARRA